MITPSAIEDYCLAHSCSEETILKKLAAETRKKTDLPQMMVGPLEGGFLRLLVKSLNARRVLEIGTFTGYSSLSMAIGLKAGGEIITCDINPDSTDIARKFWKQSPHGKKIKLRLGPAVQTLKTLKGFFDLVFIDADKANYLNYWKNILPRVRKGGVILVDNVLWSGRVLKPKEETARVIARFNQTIRRDKRVDIIMLPIRDGITMAVKK
jgi:caffeoyl-CoA O-methyltransferase